ncbi:hypothetical protein HNP55_003767 [Paucibacter oligotrophus]|uniref:Uncharacterized protein n=1 Tax=Roseateles oligotrophus TaxID=1769250 RepID=A0A840LAM0_9BURK|nr:hypothetical protein [Roseateles oligotrophus]MBB4845220.1 hypothetical protein [Roseateles oligotrophus]
MNDAISGLMSIFSKVKNSSSKSISVVQNKSPDLLGLTKSLAGMPVHVVEGLTDVLDNALDYLRVAEEEKTKREDISAKRDAALAEIRARRDIISQLMTYTFEERAVVIKKQFDVLDRALADGNVELVNASLISMVDVVKSSPFKSIQEMQSSLANKDFTIRLE